MTMIAAPSDSASLAQDFEMESLCRSHWARLHATACQRGLPAVEAADAVQDLFLQLLRSGQMSRLLTLPSAHQTAYLQMKLRSVMLNRWRDAHCQRRGGQSVHLPLHELDEVPHVTETPASQHDLVWLRQCLEQALGRLRHELRPHTWNRVSTQITAVRASCESNAHRAALLRARVRLRTLLREEMNGSFCDWITPPRATS